MGLQVLSILQVLTRYGLIRTEHLDMLWAATEAEGTFDVVKANVYAMIQDLAAGLDEVSSILSSHPTQCTPGSEHCFCYCAVLSSAVLPTVRYADMHCRKVIIRHSMSCVSASTAYRV